MNNVIQIKPFIFLNNSAKPDIVGVFTSASLRIVNIARKACCIYYFDKSDNNKLKKTFTYNPVLTILNNNKNSNVVKFKGGSNGNQRR